MRFAGRISCSSPKKNDEVRLQWRAEDQSLIFNAVMSGDTVLSLTLGLAKSEEELRNAVLPKERLATVSGPDVAEGLGRMDNT